MEVLVGDKLNLTLVSNILSHASQEDNEQTLPGWVTRTHQNGIRLMSTYDVSFSLFGWPGLHLGIFILTGTGINLVSPFAGHLAAQSLGPLFKGGD